MSRTVLIILGALAAAIVIGVLAWRSFGGPKETAEQTPRIAIVTDQLLRAAADANALAIQQSAWIANERNDAIAQMAAGSAGTTSAPAQPAPAPAAAPQQQQGNSAQAEFLRNALTDELEAQINKMLTQSRRFAVMDASSVRSAIERLSTVRTEQAQQQQQAARTQTAGGALIEGAGNAVGQVLQGVQSSTTQVSGTVQQGNDRTSFAGTQVVDSLEKGDLAGAAAELEARYLLAVSLREPRTTREHALVSGELKYRIESDPVFVYRLFDVRRNQTVVSDATQLGAPVVVEVSIPLDNQTLEGAIQSANYQTELLKAQRELSNKVQERVARHIADAVLEATFPALLASASPLMMNRGSNDGVEEGENVTITRRGAEIKDGDIVIDYEESPVGAARVIEVKANSARLEVTSGAGFAKGDIVRRTGGGGDGMTATAGGGAGSGRGLGKEDILASRANANAIRERVAVGNIRIVRDDSRIFTGSLQMDRAISERLARDPRIEVMSRESLGALADERAIGGARKTYERGGAGVGQAGYLVLGDVTVDVKRNAQYIEVPGAEKRLVSSSNTMVANGSLRIERLDSRLIDSFQVSASAPVSGAAGDAESARKVAEAFADAAARAILPRLFPMEVVQVQGATVVLNRGEDVGMKTGATYAVYAVGDPIIDSTTGAQISAGVRRQVGTVRIDDVQRNVSVATIVGNGGGIAVGQIAEASSAPAAASSAARRPAAKEKKSEEPAVPF
jgi:hypothetical protein